MRWKDFDPFRIHKGVWRMKLEVVVEKMIVVLRLNTLVDSTSLVHVHAELDRMLPR